MRMDNLDNAVIKILKHMDVKASHDSFDNRLDIQKTIYLAQEMGLKLGLSYNWYIRGPYSPDLSNLIYDVNVREEDSTINLTEYAKDRLNMLKEFVSNSVPESMKGNVLSWKELLASIHYLKFKNGYGASKINEIISTQKPWYSEEEVKKAIKCVDEKFV